MNNQTTLTDHAKDYLTYQVNRAYFSTARIDKVSDVMRFQISITKYLDFINVSKRPEDFYDENEHNFKLTPEIKEYWLDCFKPLLESPLVVQTFNKHGSTSINDKMQYIYFLRTIVTYVWLVMLKRSH